MRPQLTSGLFPVLGLARKRVHNLQHGHAVVSEPPPRLASSLLLCGFVTETGLIDRCSEGLVDQPTSGIFVRRRRWVFQDEPFKRGKRLQVANVRQRGWSGPPREGPQIKGPSLIESGKANGLKQRIG